jgi:lipopolysaccharide export system protein LptA
MIFDSENRFSNAQQVDSNEASTNRVYLEGNVAPSQPFQVVVAATKVTTGDTLTVEIEESTDDISYASLSPAVTYAKAIAADGDRITFHLPQEISKPYVRLNYTLAATGDFLVDAGIVAGLQA